MAAFQATGGALADLDDDWDVMETDTQQTSTPTGQAGVPLMQFCPYDSSMLCPKEDKKSKKLTYACRLCNYTTPSTNNLIYRNTLKKEAASLLSNVTSSLVDDPTLSRTSNGSCPSCGGKEAVFFQSEVVGQEALPLIFICVGCGWKWVSG
mmetsp:Transcript_4804/g.9638  ORF Transcript_4804/g.9638 Transcript_4804/m.9638 type:complete len:151 (+) Transcript_4804:56-508(+)|eukprot:CAMPEP_0118654528 /NCGR_PEP_ID=MMETSP0785-20121206/12443_1 /TAXON_ID=91992 /ORGANISM="Bolidomonas pacifica, Strain CCMP 1866" /LENGTH=150 /DNA_ID=CAMNT_0006547205 /DNA_START=62 /DNA_END=510 /DNA_ORIENTATION=+